MKRSKIISIVLLVALIMSLTNLTAFAKRTEKDIIEEMAANSAAWHLANAAGDKETMERLEKENQENAKELAGNNGSANYDPATSINTKAELLSASLLVWIFHSNVNPLTIILRFIILSGISVLLCDIIQYAKIAIEKFSGSTEK